MPTLEFPKNHVGQVQELGTRLLDSRKPGTNLETMARGLLGGFHDICLRSGLDRVLAELEQANPPLDITDRAALADHPTLMPALVARLQTINLDAGGPRNARPGQLSDCVVGALGLTLADEPDRTIALDDAVRAEVAAAIAGVIEVELAVPNIREAIIAKARERCELRHRQAFDKIAAQLDERGMRLIKQPNVPIDSVQAVQRVLFDTRNAIVEHAAQRAIDGAKAVLARANPEAAARIDAPITLRLTPRDVAIVRACDPSVPKTPAAITAALFDGLTSLSRLVWRAAVKVARPYSSKETFAVGELVEHPKFGRGLVVSSKLAKIEVDFPDGKLTLVHVHKP